jgi:hypothetical protein
MDIGKTVRILEVDPEPFPLGHPENDPEEPAFQPSSPQNPLAPSPTPVLVP